MKDFYKKYFIISILSVIIHFIILEIFTSPIRYIDYALHLGLVVNAIFIAPALIVRKLSISEKETFTKILAKISICFFIVTLVFAYVMMIFRHNNYLIFIGIWVTIVIFLFVFSVITIIYLVCVIIYADIKGMGEHINTIVSLMLKNLLISFYASLIIVSFHIFVLTLIV